MLVPKIYACIWVKLEYTFLALCKERKVIHAICQIPRYVLIYLFKSHQADPSRNSVHLSAVTSPNPACCMGAADLFPHDAD